MKLSYLLLCFVILGFFVESFASITQGLLTTYED